MPWIIDWIIDVLIVVVERDLVKLGDSSFVQFLKNAMKTYQKASRLKRAMDNPTNLIKTKALAQITDKSNTINTWWQTYKEIKNYKPWDPRSWRKAQTISQRHQIRINEYVDNDFVVNMGETSTWIDYMIWRAINRNSIYGWLILKVKYPTKENASGIYLFPPIVSLNIAKSIQQDPNGKTFWEAFYRWWRTVYPHNFFSKKIRNSAKFKAQMGAWGNVIDLSNRGEWDRVRLDENGKRLPTMAQKMRNRVSKWHSNYLMGFGKVGKGQPLTHFNPLTKRFTKYPSQFHRLLNDERYSRVYGRHYIIKNRNRLINREITAFSKRHPLAPKKIIRKVRATVNKYYNG